MNANEVDILLYPVRYISNAIEDVYDVYLLNFTG